jgi:hypothetical protein
MKKPELFKIPPPPPSVAVLRVTFVCPSRVRVALAPFKIPPPPAGPPREELTGAAVLLVTVESVRVTLPLSPKFTIPPPATALLRLTFDLISVMVPKEFLIPPPTEAVLLRLTFDLISVMVPM